MHTGVVPLISKCPSSVQQNHCPRVNIIRMDRLIMVYMLVHLINDITKCLKTLTQRVAFKTRMETNPFWLLFICLVFKNNT